MPEIYTIVALSTSDFQQKFDNLKKDLGLYDSDPVLEPNKLILKNKAHFAIKRSFTLKTDTTEERLITSLRNIDFPSLIISSTVADTFTQSNYGAIVYLKINLTPKLQEVHQNIKSHIDDIVDTKNPEHEGDLWIPHMTFSYNTPLDKMATILENVTRDLLPFEYSIDKLYLLKEIDHAKDIREIVNVMNCS